MSSIFFSELSATIKLYDHFYRLSIDDYIKPDIEYCCVVWSDTSCNKNKINRLQQRRIKLYYLRPWLQRRACKLILSQEYNAHQEALARLDLGILIKLST